MNNKSEDTNNIDYIKEKYDEYSKLLYTSEINKYVDKNSKYNKQYRSRSEICQMIMWMSSYTFIFTILGLTCFKTIGWYAFIVLLFTGIVPILYNAVFEFFWNIVTKSRQDEEEKEKTRLIAEYKDKIYKEYEPFIKQYEEYKNNRTSIVNINKKSNYKTCPRCGGRLIRKKGRYGYFVGCSNYPRCRYTRNR